MKFGYFTPSDNSYRDNLRSTNQFVADSIDEAIEADRLAASRVAKEPRRLPTKVLSTGLRPRHHGITPHAAVPSSRTSRGGSLNVRPS
jgi:hypothetical protein